jgi:prolyl 4-hydroxylase
MLHAHPPIFCVYEFLTPAECDFLIEAASDAFGPAPVVGKGQGEVSPSRTSSTCYLAREDLPEVSFMEYYYFLLYVLAPIALSNK